MGFNDYMINTLGDDYRHYVDGNIYHCPFCYKNHDYKLYVKDTLDETDGLWNCKRCKRYGNPAQFVMEYEGVSFPEAMDILELYDVGTEEDPYREAYDNGLTLEETLILKMKKKEREEIVEQAEFTPPPLPQGFQLLQGKEDSIEAAPFFDYLYFKRNIPLEAIYTHNIGYITEGSTIMPDGRELKLNNHVVFLTHDNNGNYMYWNTRSIDPNPYIKSLNAPATETQYSKKNTLFNMNIARNQQDIVLLEGVLDAITIGHSGVAGFGKHYTNKQIELVLDNIQSPEQRVYVYLDRDAGDASVELGQRLARHHKNTYIVNPPTYDDPNDIGQERAWEVIRKHSVQASAEGVLLAQLNTRR